MKKLLGLFVLLISTGLPADDDPEYPNVLLILADDLGANDLRIYDRHDNVPLTPNIDALAAKGMRFERAMASALCSPSRANLLTGLYGASNEERTGAPGTCIGHLVSPSNPDGMQTFLSPDLFTLPRLFIECSPVPYEAFIAGKIHLKQGPGEDNVFLGAREIGFPKFGAQMVGNLNAENGYYSYRSYGGDGQLENSDRYLTSHQVDQTIAFIKAQDKSQPWFCMLSFNAPHAPMHEPPAHLHTQDLSGYDPENPDHAHHYFKAMVEAMDSEIGRLLAEINEYGFNECNTKFIFTSDNGTSLGVNSPFYDEEIDGSKGKSTLYQGGVNVPLVVAGPGVKSGTVCHALVHLVDIIGTMEEMICPGQNPHPNHSRSFYQHFSNPDLPSIRQTCASTKFKENGKLGLARAELSGDHENIGLGGDGPAFLRVSGELWLPGRPADLEITGLGRHETVVVMVSDDLNPTPAFDGMIMQWPFKTWFRARSTISGEVRYDFDLPGGPYKGKQFYVQVLYPKSNGSLGLSNVVCVGVHPDIDMTILREDGYKYIANFDRGYNDIKKERLFDLNSDPRERENLLDLDKPDIRFEEIRDELLDELLHAFSE